MPGSPSRSTPPSIRASRAALYPHVIAAKALTFKLAGTDAFRERMERTLAGARIMAELLVAAEDRTGAAVVTGGTDVHQMLVDLAPGGREAGAVLRRLNRIGFSANAITLAYDPLAPPACSGLRFGAAALAARGFTGEQFAEVGGILADSLAQGGEDAGGSLAGRVAELTASSPLYSYLA